MTGDPLLEIRGLCVDYGFGEEAVHAVIDCDLTLRRGQVLGLAGESGSGKSTLAMAAIRLLRSPAVITDGQVLFHNSRSPSRGRVSPSSSGGGQGGAGEEVIDILAADVDELRDLRWSEISVVLQSALNALNPVITIGEQFDDLLAVHRPELSAEKRLERAGSLMEMVGIAADRLRSYPHELSGGMRQRAMIAMALALGPQIVILDEPTTALDVVTQREVLQQLIALRDDFGFAALFITHDLSLLVELADDIAVMYAGRVMERAPAGSLFHAPRLPYTYGLLHCFPPLHGMRKPMDGIPGSPPDLRNPPGGCAFHPRCAWAMPRCRKEVPVLRTLQPPPYPPPQAGERYVAREVACWLHTGEVAVPTELAQPDRLPLPPPPHAGAGESVAERAAGGLA